MKKVNVCLLISLAFFGATICNAQSNLKNILSDFEKLSGSWRGSLTYLDYASGKPYTMPADIEIQRIGKSNKFVFINIYPNEANANSKDTITIAADGKFIEKEIVKSRRILTNGNIEIVTEAFGKDGNEDKSATFRHTYTLGASTFINRKDVKFVGEQEWINRHQYVYSRKLGK